MKNIITSTFLMAIMAFAAIAQTPPNYRPVLRNVPANVSVTNNLTVSNSTVTGRLGVGGVAPTRGAAIYGISGNLGDTLRLGTTANGVVTPTLYIYGSGNNTIQTIVQSNATLFFHRSNSQALLGIGGSNGTVCIGNNCSPGTRSLTVSGTVGITGAVSMTGLTSSAGTNPVCIDTSTGTLSYSTACTASDENLKADVRPLQDSLAKIGILRPVSYLWKNEARGEGRQLGLIAQEVQKVYPEAVTMNDDGLASLQYTALVAPLIDAVNTLNARVKALEDELQRAK